MNAEYHTVILLQYSVLHPRRHISYQHWGTFQTGMTPPVRHLITEVLQVA